MINILETRWFLFSAVVVMVGYLLLVWTLDVSWTTKGERKNIFLLWDFGVDDATGAFWSFVYWKLPRVFRWGSLIILGVLLVLYPFGLGNVLAMFSTEILWLLLLPLAAWEITALVGTLIYFRYWWRENKSNNPEESAISLFIMTLEDL